jgi:hypothetical protein
VEALNRERKTYLENACASPNVGRRPGANTRRPET